MTWLCPKQHEAEPKLVRDVQRRLTWVRWIAAAVGSLIVFNSIGFLIPVFIDPADRWDLGAFNAPLIVAVALPAGIIAEKLSRRRISTSLRWVAEGREPDEREHRRTLGLALKTVKYSGWAWLFAGVVLTLVNGFAHSWEFAAIVFVTTWCGFETTSALMYLVSERTLRPVTARALEARSPDRALAPSVRLRLLMAWLLGTGVPLLGVLVVGVVGIAKSGVEPSYVGGAVLFLGAVALAVGLLATVIAAKAIADPVTAVRDGLEKVERGELDVEVEVDDGSEVGQLQSGFNRMAEGLREREQIRDLFGRQVGREVARAALRDGNRLGGEEREVGAFFVDIVGSTSMALSMPPTEVVRLLNRFFRIVVEVVESEGGYVNKFEGDAALCVFGAPVRSEDPAGDALCAARNLAKRLDAEVPEIDFGIGVSAGVAVAGNVGAEHRFEYTVIGDPVNEAARLSALAKQRPARALASQAALSRAQNGEAGAWRQTEPAALRGRTKPTAVARPLDAIERPEARREPRPTPVTRVS